MDVRKMPVRFLFYFGASGLVVLAIALYTRNEYDPFDQPVAPLQANNAPAQGGAPRAVRPGPARPVGDIPPQRPRQATASVNDYRWLAALDNRDLLSNRLAPPAGYRLVDSPEGSFGHWLQRLPLKAGNPRVRLHNGRERTSEFHAAVVDIDTGNRDLQQCADAAMRLRGEYLLAAGRERDIVFNSVSGAQLPWLKWAAGERPRFTGSRVAWRRAARPDGSHASFRRYMDQVFSVANTSSLERQIPRVAAGEMRIGDVFLVGHRNGRYGHAVIVVNQAVREADPSRKVFMLAQSYMPAQDVHVLKNPAGGGPWYDQEFGDRLVTPEWTFAKDSLHRFAE